MGGEGDEDLRGDARQRDDGGGRREHGERRAQRDADLAERGDREHGHDESAAFQEVAERHEEREAERVGELDGGEHGATAPLEASNASAIAASRAAPGCPTPP